jgi:hypothetical protein
MVREATGDLGKEHSKRGVSRKIATASIGIHLMPATVSIEVESWIFNESNRGSGIATLRFLVI